MDIKLIYGQQELLCLHCKNIIYVYFMYTYNIHYFRLCGFSPFSSNENSVFQNVAKGTFCFPSDVSLSYEGLLMNENIVFFKI